MIKPQFLQTNFLAALKLCRSRSLISIYPQLRHFSILLIASQHFDGVMTQDTSQIRMNAGAQSLMTPLPCFVRCALFSGYLSPHYGLATGSSLVTAPAPGPDSNILQAFLNLSHEECLTK